MYYFVGWGIQVSNFLYGQSKWLKCTDEFTRRIQDVLYPHLAGFVKYIDYVTWVGFLTDDGTREMKFYSFYDRYTLIQSIWKPSLTTGLYCHFVSFYCYLNHWKSGDVGGSSGLWRQEINDKFPNFNWVACLTRPRCWLRWIISERIHWWGFFLVLTEYSGEQAPFETIRISSLHSFLVSALFQKVSSGP